MKVFVGFGKNRKMMESVKSELCELGHEVVVLEDCADHSQTVIEKLEEFSDVDKAVMICSGDDSIKPFGSRLTKKYPRQNVVFEIGYFAAKLGREQVLIIVDRQETLSLLSDFNVCHIKMDKKGRWRAKLVQNLALR